tara:strand:- start:9059 stop:9571 length:513 start_codon:yes stop_codon:yes gene_type:complete
MLITISSCVNDDTNVNQVKSFKTEGYIAINLKNKSVKITGKENLKNEEDIYYQKINHSFVSNEKMSFFNSEDDLKSFLLNNTQEVYGTYELIIDDEIVYRTQIEKGVKINEEISLSSDFNNTEDCNYQDIRKCAVDGIHNQNWYDMTLCVLEGFGCVTHWYATCTVDLCL